MTLSRVIRPLLALLCVAATTTASETILRRAPNTAPGIAGPTFTLTLTGVDSYVGVAATAGSGVAGSTTGDLFLRTNQRVLISTNGGSSAAVTVDAAGNVGVTGSIAAASYVGSISSATNFTGALVGDVTGSQGATQVALVGGESAANVASGVQAANGATSANTANAIAKRDANGKVVVGSIQFADGSVLSSSSMRKYYLSNSQNDAAHALTQCSAGFHMASMWEIVNPTALSYETTLGAQFAYSGSGPPSLAGWIRTGQPVSISDVIGVANCNAWTTSASNAYGTTANLPSQWRFDPQIYGGHYFTAPWVTATTTCDQIRPVWCIQD